jgi:DNA repair protein RecO (recombination protein O)
MSSYPKLVPAFLLHRRCFRDHKFLTYFLTAEGIIHSISYRRSKKTSTALLQPFAPLYIAFKSKKNLPTISHLELRGPHHQWLGQKIYVALYLNEIIFKLGSLYQYDPQAFDLYEQTLTDLKQFQPPFDALLRYFEIKLIEYIGFGLPLAEFASRKTCAMKYYHYDSQEGFVAGPAAPDRIHEQSLAEMARFDFHRQETRRQSKQLLQQIISSLLDHKTIYSKGLWKRN